jgi:hypothetical protein
MGKLIVRSNGRSSHLIESIPNSANKCKHTKNEKIGEKKMLSGSFLEAAPRSISPRYARRSKHDSRRNLLTSSSSFQMYSTTTVRNFRSIKHSE